MGENTKPSGRWLTLFRHRVWVQLLSTLAINSWFTQQVTKGLPCLALNCYACPLAATACPVGSIQHFVGLREMPWYVLGVIGLAGALGGRLACGWFCPFGWFQELLYKIPTPKWRIQPRKRAAWWVLLLVTVAYAGGLWALIGRSPSLAIQSPVLFGLYLVAGLIGYAFLGASRAFSLVGLTLIIAWLTRDPWFCKLCPAGMLEGGIPQVVLDAGLRQWMGPLFWFKLVILLFFLAWMVVTRRPFCRWVCPLGAFWSPLNRWSAVYLDVDQAACIRCDRCQQVCPVDIQIYHDANNEACVRCMACVQICPVSCIDIKKR